MEQFNCTQCGLCCSKIGLAIRGITILVEQGSRDPVHLEVLEFPHPTHPDTGRCSQLTDDNLCAVYEDRPRICNLKNFHARYLSHVPIKTFHQQQEGFCKQLQDDHQRNP